MMCRFYRVSGFKGESDELTCLKGLLKDVKVLFIPGDLGDTGCS